jgi:Lipopolysaccharide-assembly
VKRRRAVRSLAVLGLALLSGCGYALLGRGIAVDPSIKIIGVPLFKDETGKTGLDQKITEQVIAELLKRGRFQVLPTATGVDAVVEGDLLDYRVVPAGFTQEDAGSGQTATTASRYAISLRARVVYKKIGVTEPIWSNGNFTFRDEYDIGDDPATFFDREEQAIDRMAESFAQGLVSAMLEAF